MTSLLVITLFMQSAAGTASLGDAALRVVMATILIAVVGFGAVLILRRTQHTTGMKPGSKRHGPTSLFGGWIQRPDRSIAVVSSQRVAPGQTLLTVDWQGRRLLLGCTPQSMNLIAEGLPQPPSDETS